MRISVFGIGYVGAVSAACLAKSGHHVIAYDANPTKTDPIRQRRAPIVEPGLDAVIAAGVDSGRLRVTNDSLQAIIESDLTLICVGTPSRTDGSIDTRFVKDVSETIGRHLAGKSQFHSVVLRSTVLPGTTQDVAVPALEAHSGKTAGADFGLGYFPEFLREGTALEDYANPGAIIFGHADQRTLAALQSLHTGFDATPTVVDIRTAEIIKYTNNAWHAIKISFANEIGNVCKASGIDSHTVMDALCSDTKLNISSAYLKPGFAFGGSCLPKDLRALTSYARSLDIDAPVLNAAIEQNNYQVRRAFEMVVDSAHNKVGLIGLSFKADTDDLRESPMITLAERLIEEGHDVAIFDPNIRPNAMTGANQDYVSTQLPHIARLLRTTIEEVVTHGDVLVVGQKAAGRSAVLALGNSDKLLIDLVRIDPVRRSDETYRGLCW